MHPRKKGTIERYQKVMVAFSASVMNKCVQRSLAENWQGNLVGNETSLSRKPCIACRYQVNNVNWTFIAFGITPINSGSLINRQHLLFSVISIFYYKIIFLIIMLFSLWIYFLFYWYCKLINERVMFIFLFHVWRKNVYIMHYVNAVHEL